jgi:hypothetical protein
MARNPYENPELYRPGNFWQEREKITSYMFAIYGNLGFSYCEGDETTNYRPFVQVLGCRQKGKTSKDDLDTHGRSIHHLYSGEFVNKIPEFLWHIEDQITKDRFHPLNSIVFINSDVHAMYEQLRRSDDELFVRIAAELAKHNTLYLFKNLGTLINEKRFVRSVNPYHIDDIRMAYENLLPELQQEL